MALDRLLKILKKNSEELTRPTTNPDGPFYTPQVFVAENHPNFEQPLWRFVSGSFATVFNDVRFKEH